jgi:hypothetical protein
MSANVNLTRPWRNGKASQLIINHFQRNTVTQH